MFLFCFVLFCFLSIERCGSIELFNVRRRSARECATGEKRNSHSIDRSIVSSVAVDSQAAGDVAARGRI